MIHARDVMCSPVISVTPATRLTEVARILLDNHISGCPVIDVEGDLRGVISRANLLEYALSVEGGALTPILRCLAPGRFEAASGGPGGGESRETAQEVMTADVITVAPDLAAAAIAALMVEKHIHRVPVVAEDRVVGIITSLDLLGVYPDSGAGPPESGTT